MNAQREADIDLPLTGIRVLDAVDGPLQNVGRILADLGAEVLRVEPASGSPARGRGVVVGGRDLTFLLKNAGKRGVAIDLGTPEGLDRFAALAASVDVVLRDGDAVAALSAAELRARHPRLVVVDLSDFGAFGPRSGWQATPDVHAALSTVLSRSGLPDVTEPLLPPEFLLHESAVAQAVWVVLLELAHVRASGEGDAVDFSIQEALIQILDPVFGVGGSARAGVPLSDLPRGRPDARHLYPIFAAKDGWVRICVLAKRQWQGMFEWLGRPEEFADPSYDLIQNRFAAAGRLYPLIGRLFAGLSVEEAVAQGQELGVPTAGLADAADVLRERAFQENGSLTTESPALAGMLVPDGWFELDDVRAGARGPAPRSATTLPRRAFRVSRWTRPPGAAGDRSRASGSSTSVSSSLAPSSGASSRTTARTSSRSSPAPSRRRTPVDDGDVMSESVAWGLRNKRSLGLNLRADEGREIFRQLVAVSDIVLTNFKPGTLASLGFDMESLRRINPGIILSESSAFGNHGPWSRRLGYGPLVRASAGLSSLWSYPGSADGFSDAITIFPDHVVARLNAAAIVALLLRRDRTGEGGRVSTAQVDAIFGAMADLLAAETVEAGSGPRAHGNDRPGDAFRGVFAARGDDEWIVVDARGDDAFRATAAAIGRDDLVDVPAYATAEARWQARAELRAVLAAWALEREAGEAAELLQRAGVPAGAMLRADDIREDPHLAARAAFGQIVQPQLGSPLIANLGEARSETLAPPLTGPAPLAAEHTREVMADVLGMPSDEIQRLLDAGVLEEAATVAR